MNNRDPKPTGSDLNAFHGYVMAVTFAGLVIATLSGVHHFNNCAAAQGVTFCATLGIVR